MAEGKNDLQLVNY